MPPTPAEKPPAPPTQLLAQPDFRRAYVAGGVSQVGDAFQFVALMWFAIATGGPLGVIAVRIGNSLPALLFGLHGGIAADRWDRRRTMIAADLVRAAVLFPAALAALTGNLPLWALVPVGFALATATSYFTDGVRRLPPVVGGPGERPAGERLGHRHEQRAERVGLGTGGRAAHLRVGGLVPGAQRGLLPRLRVPHRRCAQPDLVRLAEW